jgi:hypothetical protein
MNELQTTAYNLEESILLYSPYQYGTQMLLNCASLTASTNATHASLTCILDVFCSELANLPANAPRPPL